MTEKLIQDKNMYSESFVVYAQDRQSIESNLTGLESFMFGQQPR